MNKKRSEINHFASLHVVMLIMITVLLATGGVLHAFMKNRQIEVAREIDSTKSNIVEIEEEMKMVQMKIDRKLNRHMIRAELASRDSDLTRIPSSAVEVVTPSRIDAGSVAQTAL